MTASSSVTTTDDVKGGRPRITAVDSFLVAPQWLFVRIRTDAGLWVESAGLGRGSTFHVELPAVSLQN